MELYLGNQAPIQESMGETRKLQALVEELQKQNEDLSTKLGRTEAKIAQNSSKDKPSSSAATPKTSSLDLHWNEEGERDEMSEDEHLIV